MKNIESTLRDKLPLREDYVDCSGKIHTFEIYIRDAGVGTVLHAREITESDYGYEFDVREALPFHGLGKLRRTIKCALSQKHIANDIHGMSLTHNQMNGRIADKGLVIDGNLLAWEKLKNMLSSYEGFPITISIGRDDE